jgi:HEAT repeat protein
VAESSTPPPDVSGLPPVIPPSGRMIAQLFVVPGLIVAGAIAIIFGFTWLAGGHRTPDSFLDGLKSANPEVRWRAASDLAQVLLRDDTLAADPRFGLELTSFLRQSAAELKPMTKPPPGENTRERDRFLVQRNEVQYLAACVGNLSLPVGAAVLSEIATQPINADEKTDALLRRQAVWALATLGGGRSRWDKLPEAQKKDMLAKLDQQAAGVGDKADWARQASEILSGKSTGGVIAALAKCAANGDPFVRKQAALALAFWNGTDDENKLAEETLIRLTRDDGRGKSIEIMKED